MTGRLNLVNGAASAVISTTGAELLSCRIDGRELIWAGDAASWTQSAPVLFPFCGWFNQGAFRAKGKVYRSGVHGFGPKATFSAEPIAANALRLRLHDSAESRALFPYAFGLTIDVTLDTDGVRYAFAVTNPGDEPLPYAIGFHPGFCWPFDGGDPAAYRIVFAEQERAVATRIAPGGLFTDETIPLDLDGRVLDFARTLHSQDSLPMRDANSRSLSFTAPSGAAIEIAVENLPHWVFWSLPKSPYLCIEGWSGYGDPVGFVGDLAEKPGLIHLKPGEERRHAFGFRFRPAAK